MNDLYFTDRQMDVAEINKTNASIHNGLTDFNSHYGAIDQAEAESLPRMEKKTRSAKLAFISFHLIAVAVKMQPEGMQMELINAFIHHRRVDFEPLRGSSGSAHIWD